MASEQHPYNPYWYGYGYGYGYGQQQPPLPPGAPPQQQQQQQQQQEQQQQHTTPTLHDLAASGDPITKALANNIIGCISNTTNAANAVMTVKTKTDKKAFCDLCQIEVSSPIVLQVHIKGKAHQKKLAKANLNHNNNQTEQSIVQSVSPSSSISTATLSTTTATATATAAAAASYGQSSLASGMISSEILKCELCQVTVNSYQQLQTHLAGSKHRKVEEKLKRANGRMTLSQAPHRQLQQRKEAESSGSSSDVPGTFHCGICDIYLNTEVQLREHLASNVHPNSMKEGEDSSSSSTLSVKKKKFKNKKWNFNKKRKNFTQGFLTSPADAVTWKDSVAAAAAAPLMTNFVPGSVLR